MALRPHDCRFAILSALLTAGFFERLDDAIQRQSWWSVILWSIGYPCGTVCIGGFSGSFLARGQVEAGSKAFHLIAFVVVNLIQTYWIVVHAPTNLVWLPIFVAAWAVGLWLHLRWRGPVEI